MKIYLRYKKPKNSSDLQEYYEKNYIYKQIDDIDIKNEYDWQYMEFVPDENQMDRNIFDIDFRNILPNGEYFVEYFFSQNDSLKNVNIKKAFLIVNDIDVNTTPTPILITTPTPTPLI